MIKANPADRRAHTETKTIVDWKLPLSWLIALAISFVASVAGLGWQAASLSNKVDQLIISQIKAEKRAEEKDIRAEALKDAVAELRRTTDLNTLRITTLERVPQK